MRQIIKALAFIAGLVPALAAAQQFNTIPPNTVIGRLGVSAGPAQALPLSSVFSTSIFDQLSTTPGAIPYRGAGSWTALAPSTGLLFNNGTTPSYLSLPLGLANGGSGQITAALARASAGFNIEGYTAHGDSIYTILATDRTVGTSAALTAARIWTLPAANSVNAGQEITVSDYFGGVTSVNTLTIQRSGSDTISGATSVIINKAYDGYRLRSDGVSKWSAVILNNGITSNLSIKTPKDYGAACDGTTDDSLALQAWFDGIRNYAYLGWGIPGATCIYGNNTNFGGVFASMMAVRSNTIIAGNYMTLKLKASSQANSGLNGYDGAGAPNQTSGVSNVDISKLIIDGNRSGQTNTIGSAAQMYFVSSSRILLRDNKTINGRGDGIYIGGDSSGNGVSSFVTVQNHEATGNYRNGMSVVGVDRSWIIGGLFNSNNNTNNDGPQCGIDFEPNGSTTKNTNILTIGSAASSNGGTLSTTGGSGICVFNSAANTSNLIFYGLVASSNQRYGFDAFASGGPANVRLSGMSGVSNGTALVDTANVVDWFPTGIVKGAANGCGAGFACVGVPN